MKIRILNMKLLNFKGVRNLNVEFGDITNISGENGTGKTTVNDAFTWLLFGKNSEDAKDFNIKTLDKDNRPIHKLEHEVTATLEVDGREITFRRVFKEKWVKKRGEAESEFTGHETLFFVDDVPLSQQEYKSRVDFIMNESIAKMITSPTYFNSIKWQDRRQVLEAMAGTISDEDIAGDNKEFRNLLSMLGNESLIDFKKKLTAKKGLLKQSLEAFPTRIDEAQRSLPEVEDYEALEKEISTVTVSIQNIDKQIEDKASAYQSEFEKIQEKQREKHQLEMKLKEVKLSAMQGKKDVIRELEDKLRTITSDIKSNEQEIESNSRQINNNNLRINKLNEENQKLRTDWEAENAKTLVIDEKEFCCPACKQALPEANITETRSKLTTNFNNAKATKLNNITSAGTGNKQEIERLRQANGPLEEKNKSLKAIIEQKNLDLQKLYKDKEKLESAPEVIPAEVKILEKQIADIEIPKTPVIDNAKLKEEKQELTTKLDGLKARLANKEQIARLNKRIEELEKEEKAQAQELANLERTEFTIAAFSKARIETIEGRINDKFKVVKFKMFEQQINGGETECCECMVNGVPYSDVNTAGKINAGIDIINALTAHYNLSAPVFIDNRESIINIIDCESQIINLRAMKGVHQLTVEVEDLAAA